VLREPSAAGVCYKKSYAKRTTVTRDQALILEEIPKPVLRTTHRMRAPILEDSPQGCNASFCWLEAHDSSSAIAQSSAARNSRSVLRSKDAEALESRGACGIDPNSHKLALECVGPTLVDPFED
jgi:hypothetical protein